MCEPTTLAIAAGTLQAAGQINEHAEARRGVSRRNRHALRVFDYENEQYLTDVMLNNNEWKNDVQVQDIEQDYIYQSMVDQWTQQDQQLDKIFAQGDQKIENAIIEMYENDYAGTQTGRTAGRLAGKSAKKLGMLKSRELHSMMMSKDIVQLRKDSIRDESQSKSWNLYENIRFAPIHGHTPMAPSLEAAPSKASLILGLASSAVSGIGDFKDAQAPKVGSGKPDASPTASTPAPAIGGETVAAAINYASPDAYNLSGNAAQYKGSEIDSSAAWGVTL